MTPDAPWFDSHCHLQEEYLDEGDGGGVRTALERARAAGVGALVCVGTGPGTSLQALALSDAVAAGDFGPDAPRVFATVGLHPHQASDGTGEVARLVAESAVVSGRRRLVAVGECGLDYHYDHSPRDAQRVAFAEQMALAHLHDLTLVIHARSAWDDLFDVLDAEGVPARTVLHCFTGGPLEVRRCLDAGMFVSFSGIVTFKNAEEVREAAAACPEDRILVETDAPFLAPVPHRGQPNAPAYVPLVGAALAAVRGVSEVDLAATTAANTAAAFAL